MNRTQLEELYKVYIQISKGISDPITINRVYAYIPNVPENPAVSHKIRFINRYVTFNYDDLIKEYNKEDKRKELENSELSYNASIGTIENRDKQSHTESNTTDPHSIDSIENFLTSDEKKDLKSPLAGTVLEIISDDKKIRRTRTKK